jgi:hypothetical protein
MDRATDRRLAAALCVALLAVSACRPRESRVQLFEVQVSDLERAVGFYQAVLIHPTRSSKPCRLP